MGGSGHILKFWVVCCGKERRRKNVRRSFPWYSCVKLLRNSSCCRSMRVRNLIQRIHTRLSLEFVLDVLALSQASRADDSLPKR